jgi:hypothetical protein
MEQPTPKYSPSRVCLGGNVKKKKKQFFFFLFFFFSLFLFLSFFLSANVMGRNTGPEKTPPTTPIVDFVGDKKIVEVPIESTSLIFLAVIAMWFPRLCKDVGTLIDSFSSVRPVPWGSPMLWYA